MNITQLDNYGDQRGYLFRLQSDALEFLKEINDIHVGTIRPGAMRGNHYHIDRKEILFIFHSDDVQVAWAKKDETDIGIKDIKGEGAVALKIEEEVAHAKKIIGHKDIFIVSLSDKDSETIFRDTIRYNLIFNSLSQSRK